MVNSQPSETHDALSKYIRYLSKISSRNQCFSPLHYVTQSENVTYSLTISKLAEIRHLPRRLSVSFANYAKYMFYTLTNSADPD